MKHLSLKTGLLLLVGSSFVVFQSAAIILLEKPPMTKERLLGVFADHPEVTELNQLPGVLPEDFRANFVLKHGFKRNGERGHLFEEKVSQSSDPLLPRAIIYDERTGFTLSYNGGGPGQTAGDRLDMLSFDASKKTFSLEQIDFPIRAGAPEVTTSDCNSCHGPNSRPVFSMYPDWPSFYGSDNDELTGPSPLQRKEMADFTKFRQGSGTSHPRYAPLFEASVVLKNLGVSLYPSYPYRPNNSAVPTDVSRAFTFRPELRMGVIFNRLQAQSLLAKLKTHPNYDKYAPYLLHNLLQCSWPTVGPEATKSQFLLTEIKNLLKATPTTLAGDLLDYRQMWSLFGLKLNDVDIRFSYNHAGYKNTDASKDVMGVGYIGRYFNSYFDGSATIDELLSAQLYQDLAQKNPRLRGLTHLHGLSEKYAPLKARYAFDKNFFDQADRLSRWIPIPYPRVLAEAHHREAYKTEFSKQREAVCSALRAEL